MNSALKTESPAVQAWVRLLRGHAAASRALTTQLSREHGLSINDYEALLLLAHAEGERLRRTDLARSLELTPSGITRLLDGLELAGYVDREACSVDARVTYAVLTDTGRAKLEKASCSHVAAIAELFEGRYTTEELETLAELLARLPSGADPACLTGTPS